MQLAKTKHSITSRPVRRYHKQESSLRRKRFRVVSEQGRTEERRGTGFSVLAARKMGGETLVPLDPFAPKPYGNARYAG